MYSTADKELRVYEENLINNFFADVEKLIDKPVETTNEQPKIKSCICEWDKCTYVCRGKDDKYNINKQCQNTKKIIKG